MVNIRYIIIYCIIYHIDYLHVVPPEEDAHADLVVIDLTYNAKVEKLHIYCRGCYDDVCIRTDIIIGIGINIAIKFRTIEVT